MARGDDEKSAQRSLLGNKRKSSDEHELASLASSDDDNERKDLLREIDDEDDVLRASRSKSATAYIDRPRNSIPIFRLPTKRCLIILVSVIAIVLFLLGGSAYHVVRNIVPADGQSPPWYPSPKGGSDPSWEKAYAKAAKMVSKMSLMEKVNVTTGTGWAADLCVGNTAPAIEAGFPALCLQDGPLGLRFADHATAWPAGIHVGATWNKELMHLRGKLMGQEARGKGVNVILGPSVGPLGRMPAGGRNWEGFGPDPVLAGIAAAETVRGIQEEGVIATIKHFVANEQEHFRQSWEWGLPNAMSVYLDDRTLMELYAWPFQNAIKAGVGSLMCSYNQVNSSYACGNSRLMNGIIKHEFGFQGFIQSDWLAKRSGVGSALAGLDMDMPGDGLLWARGNTLWGQHLTMAVLNGSLPIERLNDMALRVVASWYQMGQDDEEKWPKQGPNGEDGPNFSSWTNEAEGKIHEASDDETKAVVNQFVDVQGFGKEFHGRTAKEIAAEGMVLLKNERSILPFNSTQMGLDAASRGKKHRIGIFGEDAGPAPGGPNMCEDRSCNEGTLAMGWGSGAVEFPYLVDPLKALESAFDFEVVDLSVDISNKPATHGSATKPSPADQDICLVFASADAGEGFHAWAGIKGDRNDLNLQKNGDKLITTVASSCGGPVIVVIHTVGPVTMEDWIDHPNILAVLNAGLPGEESGNALTDILFGNVDATGRLPYTIAKREEDYGDAGKVLYIPNGAIPTQEFSEGLLMDYRHFDHYGISPRFEFGFGLSFTTFELSDLVIKELKSKSQTVGSSAAESVNPVEVVSQRAQIRPEEALFPQPFRKLKGRVYPYLEPADLPNAYPPNATNGKSGFPYPDGYNTSAPQPRSKGSGGVQGGHPDLWEDHLEVSISVTNTGSRSGKQVVQVYIGFPITKDVSGEDIESPPQVLRQFEKTNLLQPGEKQTVDMKLNRRDLSFWSTAKQEWIMPLGEIEVSVGTSSRSIYHGQTW